MKTLYSRDRIASMPKVVGVVGGIAKPAITVGIVLGRRSGMSTGVVANRRIEPSYGHLTYEVGSGTAGRRTMRCMSGRVKVRGHGACGGS